MGCEWSVDTFGVDTSTPLQLYLLMILLLTFASYNSREFLYNSREFMYTYAHVHTCGAGCAAGERAKSRESAPERAARARARARHNE